MHNFGLTAAPQFVHARTARRGRPLAGDFISLLLAVNVHLALVLEVKGDDLVMEWQRHGRKPQVEHLGCFTLPVEMRHIFEPHAVELPVSRVEATEEEPVAVE